MSLQIQPLVANRFRSVAWTASFGIGPWVALVGFALIFVAGSGLQRFSGGRTAENARNAANLRGLPAASTLADTVPAAWNQPAAAGNVVEVKMVTTPDGASGAFKPANVTVRKGDILRFITDGKTVHNVSFPPSENAGKANLPSLGPYLTTPNSRYEMLTASLDTGTYNFQCDPHAAAGMKGTLTVQ